MSETSRWALPLLAAGQAQKEVTHNEAIVAIDRLLHLAVTSRTLASPPAAVADGAVFIVADDAQAEWRGQARMLAIRDGGGWAFAGPRTGCLAWIIDEGQFAAFAGDKWSTLGAIGDHKVPAPPTAQIVVPFGGATVDRECRAVLTELINALGNQGVILPLT